MDRGAWQVIVRGVAKSVMTERLTLSLSLKFISIPVHFTDNLTSNCFLDVP